MRTSTWKKRGTFRENVEMSITSQASRRKTIWTISTQMYGECDNSTHFLNFELKQGSFLEVNRWEVNILEKNFLIFEVNYDISPFIINLLQYRELFSQSKVFKWRLKPWRLTWFSANQVWIWVKIGDFLEVKLQNVHRT